MARLAPSILAADFNCLGEQIRILEENKIKCLHIDVMDGVFVPTISFGVPVIESLRPESGLFFDVHLMVQDPVRHIKAFKDAGADGMTVHVEACNDLGMTLQQIKNYGCKAAVAINPDTPLEKILKYLKMVDMVLVMSVYPGFGGQSLIEETLEKVKILKKLRAELGYDYLIEIDGGIKAENVAYTVSCGVDVIVAGTAVFNGDISQNIEILKRGIDHAS